MLASYLILSAVHDEIWKFGVLFRISPRVVFLYVSIFKSLLGLKDLVVIRSMNVMFCLPHVTRSQGPNPFCFWGLSSRCSCGSCALMLVIDLPSLGHFQPHQHYTLHCEVGSNLAECLLWPILVSHQCSLLGILDRYCPHPEKIA